MDKRLATGTVATPLTARVRNDVQTDLHHGAGSIEVIFVKDATAPRDAVKVSVSGNQHTDNQN